MENKKIFFIGGGMMAEGIIKELINDKIIQANEIGVFDIIESRMEFLKKTYEINTYKSISQGVESSDIVFLAVGPQDISVVLKEINEIEKKDFVIVSIAAGINIKNIVVLLVGKRKIVRIMPNPSVEAKCGVSAICWNENVTEKEDEFIEKMMKSIGDTVILKESLFDAFTGYCCSGGAYVYEFIESMIDAGVLLGFSRNQAIQFTLENVMGAAKTIKNTNYHPVYLKERMTSPAGTTIAGLHVLNEKGFKGIVQNAIQKAVERAKEIKLG
jgi:pyrroline-5-carboxylate reductase